LSYLVSVMSLITDWTCSLLPCFVVWNLQMKSRLKASVCGVLALGMVASAATIVRLPYLKYYNIPTNYLCTFDVPRQCLRLIAIVTDQNNLQITPLILLSGLSWSAGLASSVDLYLRSVRCSSHGWKRVPKEGDLMGTMGTVHSSMASLVVQAAERRSVEASRWDTCPPRVPDTRQRSRRLREHKGHGRNWMMTLAVRSV
jgi:hypothetical protein